MEFYNCFVDAAIYFYIFSERNDVNLYVDFSVM